MKVLKLESQSSITIGQIRAAAGDMKDSLQYLRAKAMMSLAGCKRASDIEKAVYRYARWLSTWHQCMLPTTYDMHFRNVRVDGGRHISAILQIKHEIAALEEYVADKTVWIAVPNTHATKARIESALVHSIGSIDRAIEACDVLEGHAPAGRAA